ncbi:MAG: hypothetical protein FWD58_01285 [Firmicutes bacterium]|nr:hypothetical protein [Bacillota bacterium]
MKIQELIKKYHKKLTKEAIVKSAVAGFIFGFIAGGLLSASALIFSFNGLWTVWVAGLLGLVAGLAAGRVFYLYKFRPSFSDAAARVDKLGLEERTLTMLELEDSETVIARVQREDGKENLKTVNPKMMKMRFSARMIATVAVAAIFGLSVVSTAAAIAVGTHGSGQNVSLIPGPGSGSNYTGSENPETPLIPPMPVVPVPGDGDTDGDDDGPPIFTGGGSGSVVSPPNPGEAGIIKGGSILDGKTPYDESWEVWEQYFLERMKDPTLSAEMRALAETYYLKLKSITV